jgi:hypothetical protein
VAGGLLDDGEVGGILARVVDRLPARHTPIPQHVGQHHDLIDRPPDRVERLRHLARYRNPAADLQLVEALPPCDCEEGVVGAGRHPATG